MAYQWAAVTERLLFDGPQVIYCRYLCFHRGAFVRGSAVPPCSFFFCLRCRDEMFLLSRAFTFLLSNQILCFLKGLGNFQLLAKDRGPHGSLKIKLLFLFCFFNKSDHLGQSGQRKFILLLHIFYIICVWICGICDISSPTINDRQTSSSSVKLRIFLHL